MPRLLVTLEAEPSDVRRALAALRREAAEQDRRGRRTEDPALAAASDHKALSLRLAADRLEAALAAGEERP